jgi:putative ABC transport system substrate-binding protein
MIKRREFITLLGGAAAWPAAARAQQAQKVPVIGFLNPGFRSKVWTALIEGLRDIGYVDGETIKIEPRWALGRPETLPGLAQELVRIKVDVLVAVARPSIEALRGATTGLPIVAVDLESDPVESGFVASLARPGGNLTGLFLDLPTLCGKWLQLIGEAAPSIARIAVLWDSKTGSHQLNAMKAAARMMSVDLMIVEFHDSVGLDAALSAGLKERPHALIQLGSPLINQLADRIADTLASHRVPSISPFRSFPENGGFLSYGPDLTDMYRRVAPYVSKILKGAKPSDLPIERPIKFEFVINLKTAKALGITIPQTLQVAADEIIE